ncbi:uncharacterized protein V1518DRAFT_419791 [Limtongia smithiae]|uniref:uncharacterized protein n=1 Tax=Limtongia smithiae TaxID=1125753 RepID=UPI0034CFEC5F
MGLFDKKNHKKDKDTKTAAASAPVHEQRPIQQAPPAQLPSQHQLQFHQQPPQQQRPRQQRPQQFQQPPPNRLSVPSGRPQSQQVLLPQQQQRHVLPTPPSDARRRPWLRMPFADSVSPFPRLFLSSQRVCYDNKILLFGGSASDKVLMNDVWEISADNKAVRKVTCSGISVSPRYRQASDASKLHFVVFGGDTVFGGTPPTDNNLYILDTSAYVWSIAPEDGPRPTPRHGHTLIIVGSLVYIFGGSIGNQYFDDMYCYDLRNVAKPGSSMWEKVEYQSVAPPARANHSMVYYNDRLFMFGGLNQDTLFNDTWCFDLRSRMWFLIPQYGLTPKPVESHTASVISDMMYVFGGSFVDKTISNVLYALRLTDGRWFSFQTNMEEGPTRRAGHATCVSGRRMYVLGGMPYSVDNEEMDELAFLYVLNADVITYPTETASPRDHQQRSGRHTLPQRPKENTQVHESRTRSNERPRERSSEHQIVTTPNPTRVPVSVEVDVPAAAPSPVGESSAGQLSQSGQLSPYHVPDTIMSTPSLDSNVTVSDVTEEHDPDDAIKKLEAEKRWYALELDKARRSGFNLDALVLDSLDSQLPSDVRSNDVFDLLLAIRSEFAKSMQQVRADLALRDESDDRLIISTETQNSPYQNAESRSLKSTPDLTSTETMNNGDAVQLEVDAMRTVLEDSRIQLEQHQDQVKKLSQELESKDNDIAVLLARNEEMVATADGKDEEISHWQNQVAELQTALASKDHEIFVLHIQQETKVDELTTQVDALMASNENADVKMESAIAVAAAERLEVERALKSQIEILETEVADKEQLAEFLQGQLRDLEEKEKTSVQVSLDLEQAQQQNAELLAEIATLKDGAADKDDLNEIRKAIGDIQSYAEGVEKKFDSIKKSKDELDLKYKKALAELSDLRPRVVEAESKVEQLTAENEELMEQIANWQREARLKMNKFLGTA